MRWIKLRDGQIYTFAADIQKRAETLGYRVPCEADGTRHPGTDCNAKMRTVVKSLSLRKAFGINNMSVVDVRVEDGRHNVAFMSWLVYKGVITDAYLKIGTLQLYSLQAANALICVMLQTNEEDLVREGDDPNVILTYPNFVKLREHNFEKKRNRPIVSLFKK